MIVYDTLCTPCKRKTRWNELRRFARENKLQLTKIDIKKQPQYADKALSYEMTLPFIVEGGTAIDFNEDLRRLLK